MSSVPSVVSGAGSSRRLGSFGIPSHWIVMVILFSGALGLGYALLPGQVQRVAMLEQDGQSLQARALLERSYQSGDRSFRTLFELEALYEHFGQLELAREVLQVLLARSPKDLNVQRRAANFYKMTQDEPAYVATLQRLIVLRYTEDSCRELIGIHRRNGQWNSEQAAIQSCRTKGYRRPEDIVRLASLVAVDGDLPQASVLLRGVDDLRRLKTARERTQLFVTLLETDQPREAHRRAVRWLRGTREPGLALALIDLLVIDNRHELAIELATDVSTPGDQVSLAVAEVMLDRGETLAAKTFLRGWIAKAQLNAPEVASRFLAASLDAEDPELAMTGATRAGLARMLQEDLVALAEALAAVGRQSDFDAVRAVIKPEVLAGNALLSAAVELRRGAPEAGQTLLSTVAVDELDEWRLSLWARMMNSTGRTEAASIALRRLGVETQTPVQTQTQAQPERVAVEPRMIRRPKNTRRARFRPGGALSAIRAKQKALQPAQPSGGSGLWTSGG